MKMHWKPIGCSLTLLALWGCGSSVSPEPSRPQATISGDSHAALLGMGYDTQSENFTEICVESQSRAPGERIKYAGAPTASVSFDRSLSYEQLKNLLDVQVSGKLMIEGLSVRAAARFASEAASSDLSTSLVFANKIGGLYAILNQPGLSPAAKLAGASLDSARIRSQCGDHFISQVELGAQLLVSMRFDFANKEAKSNFEAEIDLDFVSLFQVSGAAKVAMEKYKNTVGVTVSALQIGGDVSKLSQIFSDASGDSKPLLRCSLDNVDACIKVMENVVAYASSPSAGSFPSQLQNLQFDDTSPTGAAFLRYVSKSYYNAGLHELYATPPALLAREIAEARERLLMQYETQARDRRRVQTLLTLRLSAEDKARLERVDALLQDNVRRLTDTARVCYDAPTNCVATESQLRLATYDPRDLERTLEFYDYCLLQKPEAASTETVKVLRASLGASERIGCEDLERDLQNELILDLSGQNISDVRPLLGLKKLRVLDLSRNKIRNIDALAQLPALRTLRLRGNSISNIEPLAKASELESLDLAFNRILDLSPLRELGELEELRLQGNLFTDATPLAGLQLSILYLNEAQICAAERDYALAQGWISPAQHRAYAASNFGARYRIPGDRTSGLERFQLCQATVEAF